MSANLTSFEHAQPKSPARWAPPSSCRPPPRAAALLPPAAAACP